MREWVKTVRNGFGSADRVQRNCYAWRVATAMVGTEGTCPSCLGPMALGSADVDRVGGTTHDARGEIYVQGGCVYLCHACNHSRGIVQATGADWANVDAYAEAVARASAMVPMPSVRDARAWWANRDTGQGRVSQYA